MMMILTQISSVALDLDSRSRSSDGECSDESNNGGNELIDGGRRDERVRGRGKGCVRQEVDGGGIL